MPNLHFNNYVLGILEIILGAVEHRQQGFYSTLNGKQSVTCCLAIFEPKQPHKRAKWLFKWDQRSIKWKWQTAM